MNKKRSIIDKALIGLFVFSFVAVIASNWYYFYRSGNFNYLIESPCDPTAANCFYRDCENEPDSCPPNGLSYYQSFYVSAADFATCTDNSCANECTTKAISCTPILCGDSEEDVCDELQ